MSNEAQAKPGKTVSWETYAEAQNLNEVSWKEVKGPKTWRPTAGESIVGFFAGNSLRNGAHGQYEVIQVQVPGQGMLLVSGTVVVQKTNAALLELGNAVKVVYNGVKELANGHTMKLFDVFVAEA